MEIMVLMADEKREEFQRLLLLALAVITLWCAWSWLSYRRRYRSPP